LFLLLVVLAAPPAQHSSGEQQRGSEYSSAEARQLREFGGPNHLVQLERPVLDSGNLTGSELRVRQRDELPFDLLLGHMIIVKGFLPGLTRKANLLIDTGSTVTVVNRELVKQLRMDRISDKGGETKASAFGSEMKVERVVLRQLQLGRRRISRPCLAADLPWKEVDILIGLDILRATSLTIDYAKRKVAFGAGFGAGQPVFFQNEQNLAVVPVTMAGVALRLVIDTGAHLPVVYEMRVEGWGEKVPGQKRAKVVHGGGTMQAMRVTVSEAQIGEKRLTDLGVLVLPNKNSHPALDGFLGTASLGLNRIHLDFAHQALYLE